MEKINNAFGVAGLMGNLFAESALNSQNLQNNGNKALGITDAEFTAAFDAGLYGDDTFIHDGYGYGLAQWTYYSRKKALLEYARSQGKSIGDLTMQLEFLWKELTDGYTSTLEALVSATSVRAASDAMLTKFERPADQSEVVQVKRTGYGQKYYDKYAKAAATTPAAEDKPVVLDEKYARYINSTGTHQTGKEWQMRSWYNRPWSCVLRYPDQKVALKIALLAIDAALNDKVGNDQSQNRTYLKQLKAVGWEPSKITVACEADCSAGVCANVTAAGHLLGIPALQNHTGTYTGNMRSALTKAGFQLLTDSKYLNGGSYPPQ